MKTLKKSFKIIVKSIIGFILFIALYLFLAIGLSSIEVNKNTTQDQNPEVDIFIKTNGVHTDIVVPIKNDIKDWSSEITYQHTQSKDTKMNYIAFGWGDKGFYLDTPQWSDLKCSTAFKAATGLSNTAMHTTFYKTVTEDETCKKISISKVNYEKLVLYISESFHKDGILYPQLIPGHHYGQNDAFYEAKGHYSLFYTCNTWANNALKAANQKAALWTPYDGGIFKHYLQN